MDEDVHSFTVNIPKSRVFVNRSSELIKNLNAKRSFRSQFERKLRKPSDISLTNYSLPRGLPMKARILKRDELLLSYRQYTRKQKSYCHQQRLSIDIGDKYKIISTDLRKRLYVDPHDEDVRALTDIDKDFYKYANGRPSSNNMQLYKSLNKIFHDQLRLRQEIGYRKDCALNINVSFKQQQDAYDLSVRRFMHQAKYFDKFISDDYKKSMRFLEQYDIMKNQVDTKNAELQNAAGEIFTIVSRLIGLDYRYGLLQKYGRFLYYLSPPIWRMHNREFARSVELEAKGFDFGISNEEDSFAIIFEKLKKVVYDPIKPLIYFNDPCDIMNVFATIEEQQLNYFTHVTHMTPHAKTLKKSIQSLKKKGTRDSELVANIIQSFESHIEFYREKSDRLEAKFYKILNGVFYQSVGAPEVFKLFTYLEFCCEKVFGGEPVNSDIVSMAKALENFYMFYTKRLDTFNSKSVRRAVKRYLEQEKQETMRVAEATKELRCFERLKQELHRAFTPPASRWQLHTTRYLPLVKKSSTKRVRISKTNGRENKKHLLTEAEKEYLTLFTDWTEHEDPGLYLHSFSMLYDAARGIDCK